MGAGQILPIKIDPVADEFGNCCNVPYNGGNQLALFEGNCYANYQSKPRVICE